MNDGDDGRREIFEGLLLRGRVLGLSMICCEC